MLVRTIIMNYDDGGDDGDEELEATEYGTTI